MPLHRKTGGMESVPTPVNKVRKRYLHWLWILFLPLLIFIVWRSALPTVIAHYPEDGREELRYVWNVQDRIYRGKLSPGSRTGNTGFLSPADEFFMEFSWHSEKSRWHCISVTPKWPTTHIYLDADGNIDMRKDSGTDADRLKPCEWDLARP